MKRALLVFVIVASAMPWSGARAVSSHLVAAPGAFATTWTTPVLVAAPASQPLLMNTDLAFHGVQSLAIGPSTQPWCARFPAGACPLFFADLTVPADGVNPILGLENAQPGASYAFRCTVQAFSQNMRGLLVVPG